MPYKPKISCAITTCPNLSNNRYCDTHAHLAPKKQHDKKRKSSTQRGYDTRWQKARRMYLNQHPLCLACQKEHRTTTATVVDHIKPHRGNQHLFWDVSNWQPLCKQCHDKKTMNERSQTKSKPQQYHYKTMLKNKKYQMRMNRYGAC